MDHQYRENRARNIHSNHNQTRANVECSPNQSKKCTFPSSNRRNVEDSGMLSEYFSSGLQAHAYKMVITTVCAQIDNCFCNT